MAHADAKRLRDHKNTILGLIGRLRDGRPGLVTENHFRARKDDPRQTFLVGLRGAIVAARNDLPQSLYSEYLEWSTTQAVGVGFDEFPATSKALDGLFDARRVPADAELEFTARRLAPRAPQIAYFEVSRRSLTLAVLRGDAKSALSTLAAMDATLGASLWLFEIGVAVRQAFEGLEAQKRYSDAVRAPLRRSISAYLVRQASVRNEPSTTWPRFHDDLSRRVAAFGFDEAKTAYMRYRLFGDAFLGTEEALATLAAVQSYPVIDLYVAACDVVAWARGASNADAVRGATLRWFTPIETAAHAAYARIGESSGTAGSNMVEAVQAFAGGDLRRAYRLARRELKASSASATTLAVLALCSAEAPRPLRGFGGLAQTLIGDLRGIVLGGDGWQISTSSVRKLTQNFRGLPIFADLRHLVEFLARPTPQDAPRALECVFGCIPDGRLDADAETGSPFADFGRAVSDIAAGDIEAAAQRFAAAVGRGSAVADRLANTLLIHISVAQGETIQAARLLAREAARVPQAAASLPTDVVLPNSRWADLKVYAPELFPSIIMDLRWRASRDDRTASIRRFAFNDFLKHQGVTRPTHLEPHLHRFERGELIYFLRNVCVSNVMDMSSFFPNLADVEDEMISIQAWLSRLDPENRHEYDAQRLELTNNRAIHEGLRIVDSSRIHVDAEAITAWARKEMAEYFARYVGLVRAGIGVADDLTTLLKQLAAPDADLSLEPSSSEADAILIEQTQRMREQFLHNPEHGLDSYLSRRVRHHPLTAALRSPVEFANLITTRATEHGAYRENAHWLNRLEPLPDDLRLAMSSAFQTFAVEFDQILTRLKDERFHVRTYEKPNGLFDADIGSLHHHLLRAIVQLDLSLDTYIAEALGILSAQLEGSLKEAQAYLNGPVKQQFAECFDRLRGGLRLAEGSPAYSALATACGDAAAEVQRKLFEVSEWLTREEGLALSKTFSLRQILEIGIRSALDPHKEYQPNIELAVQDDDVQMLATNVALISELLLVILNNARLHGGLPTGQKVMIGCAVDTGAQTLTLRVASSLGPNARSAVNERKVRELLAAVRSGKFDRSRVRREGNSGFVKIASIVSQSKDGRLDFGFDDNGSFFVEVIYTLFIMARADV